MPQANLSLALDTEKQELTMNVFSELTINGRKLVSYKAKEGFEALLNRENDLVGSSGARVQTLIIFENREYIASIKEKLAEIKHFALV